MGPSWADLPFTVKVTPLGALDLTSRLAVIQSVMKCGEFVGDSRRLTRVGMVEVLVQELERVVY